MNDLPITEEWLSKSGFKWTQLDRQPDKHWTLWLGDCMGKHTSFEDFGIEVAPVGHGDDPDWFCWFRADYSGRYSRFLHVRHIQTQADLIRIIEGVTFQEWNPANSMYGSLHTPEVAARLRREAERLDVKWTMAGTWHKTEKDETRGRAMPEDTQYRIDHPEAREG